MAEPVRALTGEMAAKIRALYEENLYFEASKMRASKIAEIADGALDGIQAVELDKRLSDGVLTEAEKTELVDNYEFSPGFVDSIRRSSGDDASILESKLRFFKDDIQDTSLCTEPVFCGRKSILKNHYAYKFKLIEAYAKEHPEQRDRIISTLEQIASDAKEKIVREYAKGSIDRILGT